VVGTGGQARKVEKSELTMRELGHVSADDGMCAIVRTWRCENVPQTVRYHVRYEQRPTVSG
jgi:hypothetical protein